MTTDIQNLLPAAFRGEQLQERAYKPTRYEMGFYVDGLHPSVDEAHRETQWWLNDIMERATERRRWLTLFGRSGCGKTHLLTGARKALEANNRRAQKWNWAELLSRHLSGEYPGIMEQVKELPVLLLDDIGAELMATEKARSVSMKALYELLERRLNKWTFLTTNLAPDQIPDQRIASRLFRGHNIVVDMREAGDYCFNKYKLNRNKPC